MKLGRWVSPLLFVWLLALSRQPLSAVTFASPEPPRLELASKVVAWDVNVDPLYRPGPLKRYYINDSHFIGTSKQAVYHANIDNYYADLRGWDQAGLKLQFYAVAHMNKPGAEPVVIFREAYPEQMPQFCGGPASGCVRVKSPQRCVVTTAVTNSPLPAGTRTFGPMVLNNLLAVCFGAGKYIDPLTWLLYADDPPPHLTRPPAYVLDFVRRQYSLT